jgi:uncharacterized membrane protein
MKNHIFLLVVGLIVGVTLPALFNGSIGLSFGLLTPIALFILCPLMMMLMMGHMHGDGKKQEESHKGHTA